MNQSPQGSAKNLLAFRRILKDKRKDPLVIAREGNLQDTPARHGGKRALINKNETEFGSRRKMRM